MLESDYVYDIGVKSDRLYISLTQKDCSVQVIAAKTTHNPFPKQE